jgi:hypothetical protein
MCRLLALGVTQPIVCAPETVTGVIPLYRYVPHYDGALNKAVSSFAWTVKSFKNSSSEQLQE